MMMLMILYVNRQSPSTPNSTSCSTESQSHHYSTPGRERSIVMSMSVCLSVCLSASTSPESHVQPSPNFLRMLPVVMDRSFSVGVEICYVFPVFWTTSNFAVTVFTGHVYPVAAISLRVMCRLTPLLLGADGVLS